ncbi:MAG: hypothetical protein ACHQPI_03320 [Thermoanaerobaculia bacterium]
MTGVLIGLVVFVLGWFAIGSSANVRRGNAALKWLQGGLRQLGDKATVRWLGTTAVDLGIASAKGPFEAANVVVFLAPRDMPWLWALSRARGRRDTLIVRGRLAHPPLEEIEILDGSSWSGREALRGMKDERWTVRELSTPGGLAAHFKFESAGTQAEALAACAAGAGATVRRLSVRRKEPHLTFHVDLPEKAADAAAFFRTIGELGEAASKR